MTKTICKIMCIWVIIIIYPQFPKHTVTTAASQYKLKIYQSTAHWFTQNQSKCVIEVTVKI